MTKSCVIIGLGQIGMGYDYDVNSHSKIYTHARAISLNPSFSLVGAVDPSADRRTLFERQYGVHAFEKIESALMMLNPEVVVIASSSESHITVLSQVLSSCRPQLILCEKPLAYSLSEAKSMVEMCEAEEINLFVNYIRRADPGVIEVKRRLDRGDILTPVKVNAWYSKGIINNGSHFINLMEFWLGEALVVNVINRGRLWSNIDPEPEIEIKFQNGNAIVRAAWEECFSYYSLELLSQSGRLCYEKGGELIEWQGISVDKNFTGYKILSHEKEIIESKLDIYQWNVYEEINKYFRGEFTALCTGRQALKTLETINSIISRR